MFNRLRTIWPKGNKRKSPRKSHQNGDYLKTSYAKKWLFPGLPRWLPLGRATERWGQWPRGPWSLGDPWASFVCGTSKTFFFFFEITSKSGENCGIFLFVFGVYKAGNAQYLSWPRADVWLSAPLQTINEYINCFLWQITSCSLISLLIIAIRSLQRLSHRSFISVYEPVIILKLD